MLQQATFAFDLARRQHRNALSHAVPFAGGYDEDGTCLPGVGITAAGERRLIRDAEELRERALWIEDAIEPLEQVRAIVRAQVSEPQAQRRLAERRMAKLAGSNE